MSTDYVVWSPSTKKKGFKKTEYKWAMIQPVVTKIFYFTNVLNLLEFEYSVYYKLETMQINVRKVKYHWLHF